MASHTSTSPAKTSRVHANRPPAPSLFVGPPSRNASSISLTHTVSNTPSSRVPPLQQKPSPLSPSANDPQYPSTSLNAQSPPLLNPSARGRDGERDKQKTAKHDAAPTGKQSSAETDAIWAEMQTTLEEVELNASSSSHVFGPSHSAALDELRRAQIELARAWGRSETDDTSGDDAPSPSGSPTRQPLNHPTLLADERANRAASSPKATGRPRSDTAASAS
ncbi:hypothetical protein LTR28_012771, partial [Elasticomyces elasticus]